MSPWYEEYKAQFIHTEDVSSFALNKLRELALNSGKTLHRANFTKSFEKFEDLKDFYPKVCTFLAKQGLLKFDTKYFVRKKKTKESTSWFANKDSFCVNIKTNSRDLVLSVYTMDFDFLKEVRNFFYSQKETNKSRVVDLNEPSEIYAMVQSPAGIEFFSCGKETTKLVRGNYAKDVIRKYDRVCSELIRKDVDGRLVILRGRPGTGKSFFVRGIMEHVKNCMFVIVPSDYLSALASPTFLPSLLSLKEEVDFDNEFAETDLATRMVSEDLEDAVAESYEEGAALQPSTGDAGGTTHEEMKSSVAATHAEMFSEERGEITDAKVYAEAEYETPYQTLEDLGVTNNAEDDVEYIQKTHGSIVLVVEDADENLKQRDDFNNSKISAMLNFADGIIGERLDIKIICTTNLQDIQLDEAIKRPGRLLDLIDINELPEEEAIAAYRRISGGEHIPDSVMKAIQSGATIAEIYKFVRDEKNAMEFKEREEKDKKRKVGF